MYGHAYRHVHVPRRASSLCASDLSIGMCIRIRIRMGMRINMYTDKLCRHAHRHVYRHVRISTHCGTCWCQKQACHAVDFAEGCVYMSIHMSIPCMHACMHACTHAGFDGGGGEETAEGEALDTQASAEPAEGQE